MKNNSRINDAILGLMRVSKFGDIDGEDIVSGLESSKSLWKAIVPGSNIGTEHQTRNAAEGRLFFDELRILTSREQYLDLYELAKSWRPKFLGVGYLDPERVEILMMWES